MKKKGASHPEQESKTMSEFIAMNNKREVVDRFWTPTNRGFRKGEILYARVSQYGHPVTFKRVA
jgi:hypothetical protein